MSTAPSIIATASGFAVQYDNGEIEDFGGDQAAAERELADATAAWRMSQRYAAHSRAHPRSDEQEANSWAKWG